LRDRFAKEIDRDNTANLENPGFFDEAFFAELYAKENSQDRVTQTLDSSNREVESSYQDNVSSKGSDRLQDLNPIDEEYFGEANYHSTSTTASVTVEPCTGQLSHSIIRKKGTSSKVGKTLPVDLMIDDMILMTDSNRATESSPRSRLDDLNYFDQQLVEPLIEQRKEMSPIDRPRCVINTELLFRKLLNLLECL